MEILEFCERVREGMILVEKVEFSEREREEKRF